MSWRATARLFGAKAQFQREPPAVPPPVVLERSVGRSVAPVAEVRNLTKRFGATEVFRDVSLRIEGGKVVTILGRSGVGKSTLLRCLNLLELPTSGQVFLRTKCVYDNGLCISRKDLIGARRQLSMVFQQFNLFQHLTAVENVALAPIVALGEPAGSAIEAARSLLDHVGISARMLAYPSQLSGGEQQRVAIARALALRPAAILFDEPTSSLDPELRGEVLATMKQLASEGMTMVVVTHELKFAADVSDWVVFMDDGGVVEEGPVEQVLVSPVRERTRQFISSH
ncbi:MAG: amino acid ABC transporter ATP-binding protein [Rhodospirillales bacterium]|nr:amino acid ABC transporter ATP-binding protein [Rhodospirillales bacterium]